MTTTPKFGIPLISSQQASPEITHNQMVVLLQALAGGAIDEQNAPPGSPAEGATYIVGALPTGAFAGHAHAIAVFYGGWMFVPGYDDDGVIIPMSAAQNGLSIFNNATGELWAWETSSWVVVTGGTGASRLIDLLDVLVSETASQNGDYLVWNDAAGKWVNQNPPRLVDLSDVAASETSTIDGDFLAWDDAAQKWVPTPINLPSESTPALIDLPDVHVGESALEDGDFLGWDNAIHKWVAKPSAFASSILASATILVGSGSNVATPRALSGDATISNLGVISVTKSGGVAFGSAAFSSSAAFDAAGAAAAAIVTAEAYADTGDNAIRALRAAAGTFGLAKVDGTTLTAAGGVLSVGAVPSGDVVGVTDGSNAPAGCIGEVIEATLLFAAAILPASNTDINILTLALTPGDWDVSAVGFFFPSTVAASSLAMALSLTSNTLPSPTTVKAEGQFEMSVGLTSNASDGWPVGPKRVNVTVNTTVYLVMNSSWTGAGTPKAWGFMRARRMR